MSDEIVAPGKYAVEVKLRGTFTVEEGQVLTEIDVAGQFADSRNGSLVDWELVKIR